MEHALEGEQEGSLSADSHSYGGNSPRAARSQISTAVSFEGPRPAGSAAVPSRSAGEESCLSAAEPEGACNISQWCKAPVFVRRRVLHHASCAELEDWCADPRVKGEHSSQPQPLLLQPAEVIAVAGEAGPFGLHYIPQRRQRRRLPSNSLLSTAMRPASPVPEAHSSPPLRRANSVVSHTAAVQRPKAPPARAGTPGTGHGRTRVAGGLIVHASSPQGSQAGEQGFSVGEDIIESQHTAPPLPLLPAAGASLYDAHHLAGLPQIAEAAQQLSSAGQPAIAQQLGSDPEADDDEAGGPDGDSQLACDVGPAFARRRSFLDLAGTSDGGAPGAQPAVLGPMAAGPSNWHQYVSVGPASAVGSAAAHQLYQQQLAQQQQQYAQQLSQQAVSVSAASAAPPPAGPYHQPRPLPPTAAAHLGHLQQQQVVVLGRLLAEAGGAGQVVDSPLGAAPIATAVAPAYSNTATPAVPTHQLLQLAYLQASVVQENQLHQTNFQQHQAAQQHAAQHQHQNLHDHYSPAIASPAVPAVTMVEGSFPPGPPSPPRQHHMQAGYAPASNGGGLQGRQRSAAEKPQAAQLQGPPLPAELLSDQEDPRSAATPAAGDAAVGYVPPANSRGGTAAAANRRRQDVHSRLQETHDHMHSDLSHDKSSRALRARSPEWQQGGAAGEQQGDSRAEEQSLAQGGHVALPEANGETPDVAPHTQVASVDGPQSEVQQRPPVPQQLQPPPTAKSSGTADGHMVAAPQQQALAGASEEGDAEAELLETAHAAASVHATVVTEDDPLSDVEPDHQGASLLASGGLGHANSAQDRAAQWAQSSNPYPAGPAVAMRDPPNSPHASLPAAHPMDSTTAMAVAAQSAEASMEEGASHAASGHQAAAALDDACSSDEGDQDMDDGHRIDRGQSPACATIIGSDEVQPGPSQQQDVAQGMMLHSAGLMLPATPSHQELHQPATGTSQPQEADSHAWKGHPTDVGSAGQGMAVSARSAPAPLQPGATPAALPSAQEPQSAVAGEAAMADSGDDGAVSTPAVRASSGRGEAAQLSTRATLELPARPSIVSTAAASGPAHPAPAGSSGSDAEAGVVGMEPAAAVLPALATASMAAAASAAAAAASADTGTVLANGTPPRAAAPRTTASGGVMAAPPFRQGPGPGEQQGITSVERSTPLAGAGTPAALNHSSTNGALPPNGFLAAPQNGRPHRPQPQPAMSIGAPPPPFAPVSAVNGLRHPPAGKLPAPRPSLTVVLHTGNAVPDAVSPAPGSHRSGGGSRATGNGAHSGSSAAQSGLANGTGPAHGQAGAASPASSSSKAAAALSKATSSSARVREGGKRKRPADGTSSPVHSDTAQHSGAC